MTLEVTLNFLQWYTVTQRLDRVGNPKLEEDDVPGTRTVRVYSIDPRSGSNKGGITVTLVGKYFNTFVDNPLKCLFTYRSGVGDVSEQFRARVIGDARVVYSTSPTLTYVKKAFVSLTVDGSSYCVDDTLTDVDGVDTTTTR